MTLDSSGKMSGPAADGTVWLAKAVGEPFALRDDLAGVLAPPTNDSRFRYIKLTASDSYNTGVLTSESVSGSVPLVVATAIISLAASPLNGVTVNLWNTERRSPRPGSSGTLQNDAFQSHSHTINIKATSGAAAAFGYATYGNGQDSQYNTDTISGRTDIETRVKNQGVTYYMRIL